MSVVRWHKKNKENTLVIGTESKPDVAVKKNVEAPSVALDSSKNEAVTADEVKAVEAATSPVDAVKAAEVTPFVDEVKKTGEFDYLWDIKASIKANAIAMLLSYPPYRLNFLSNKHEKNIMVAKATAEEFGRLDDKISEPDLALTIYSKLKVIQFAFPAENSNGEYNKKLTYLIERIEREHPSVKENYKAPEITAQTSLPSLAM